MPRALVYSLARSSSLYLRKRTSFPMTQGGVELADNMHALTFSFQMPMKKQVVYSHWPFVICAASIDLTLPSFSGHYGDKATEFEFQPDLLCHLQVKPY